MTSALSQVLADFRKRITHAGPTGLNEQNTKATLIEPLLRALGWDTENVDEVAREYRLKKQHKPVDYGLLALRTPRLFVEAKGLGQNLNDHKWANQIMGYAAVAGVEWIVLTDGNEYRIYNSHAPVSVEEKLFRKVKIAESDPLVEETLDLLSKARLEENRLEVFWRAHFVDRQVNAALEDLFGGDNDMLLVNHVLGRTKNLTAEEVRASIRRCKYHFDFPVMPLEALTAPSKGKASRKGAKASGEAKSPETYDVSLTDIIKAGIISTPLALSCRYKGHDLNARVMANGTVQWQGQAFASLSQAASAAREPITGRRPDGKLRATNGWMFWKYKTESGEVVPIDHARQAYLQGGDATPKMGPESRAG